MGLSSSSALASNSTSTERSAWLTPTMRKPRVCDPVGWFLLRRNRCRIASSVSVSASALAVSVIRLLLPELVQGDDLGLPFGRGRGRIGIGVDLDGRRGGLGLDGGGRRRLELQQELHGR